MFVKLDKSSPLALDTTKDLVSCQLLRGPYGSSNLPWACNSGLTWSGVQWSFATSFFVNIERCLWVFVASLRQADSSDLSCRTDPRGYVLDPFVLLFVKLSRSGTLVTVHISVQ